VAEHLHEERQTTQKQLATAAATASKLGENEAHTSAIMSTAADGMITGYRGVGAMWAAETGRDALPIKSAMLADGVIVRGVGEAIIWCPPLIVTDDEIARYIETLQKALS
jgi:4-aminobutyrate--pyruvate transaminase